MQFRSVSASLQSFSSLHPTPWHRFSWATICCSLEAHTLLVVMCCCYRRADSPQGCSALSTAAQDGCGFRFPHPPRSPQKILGEKWDCRAGNHVLISTSLFHLSGEVDHYLEIIRSFLFQKKKKILVNNPKQNLSIYTWDRCMSTLCFLVVQIKFRTGNLPFAASSLFFLVCCFAR